MAKSNPNGKRPRDEKDVSARNVLAEETKTFCAETKLIRIDSSSCISSINSDASSADRADSDEFDVGSAEAKKIKEELLNILDDSEAVRSDGRDPVILGVDSVMKSFEEEIQVSPSPSPQPELDYLMEASDDELGLPPTINDSERKMEVLSPPAVALAGNMIGFEDDFISNYDDFDFGMGAYSSESNDVSGEYVALGGLFDYSDGGASEVNPWWMEPFFC